MRPMRRLFIGLSLLSLVVLGLTLVAMLSPTDSHFMVFDGGGGIGGRGELPTCVLVAGPQRTGVGWTHTDVWFNGMIGGPTWLVLLISLLSTTLWLLLVSRSQREPPLGGCPGCGYNLTGNTSGVCPECGRAESERRTGRQIHRHRQR